MKQKMFIPTIGFEFTLESDWKFDLHAERRNKSLINKGMRGTEKYSADGWTVWDLLEMKNKLNAIPFPTYENEWMPSGKKIGGIFSRSHGGGGRDTAAESRNEILRQQYRNDLQNIRDQYPEDTRSVEFLPVMLEAGTDLKVDRIYIRKGNSEYDSITFYVKSGYLRGARFWAKLDDVNQIEF